MGNPKKLLKVGSPDNEFVFWYSRSGRERCPAGCLTLGRFLPQSLISLNGAVVLGGYCVLCGLVGKLRFRGQSLPGARIRGLGAKLIFI